MAIKTALRKYTSMAAFEAEKAQLPFPSVCYIDDDGEKYVFFRNALSIIDDMLYHLGYEETPSQPDVPGDSGGGEEPENPDTPETPDQPENPDEPVETKKLSITGYPDIIGARNSLYVYHFSMNGISGTPVLSGIPSWITVQELDDSGFRLYCTQNRSDDYTFTITATLGDVTDTMEVVCHKIEIAITGAAYIEGKAGNTYDYTVQYSSFGYSVGATYFEGSSAKVENLPDGVVATNVTLTGFTLSVASNVTEDVRQTIRYVVDGIVGRSAIDFAHYSSASTKDFGNMTTYVDMGLPSGTLWAQQNIGAAKNDAEVPGDYYAWGEDIPKSSYESQKYTGSKLAAISSDIVNLTYAGDWRMPTLDDIEELITNSDASFTTFFGEKVVKLTSKINGNALILPRGGYKSGASVVDSDNCYLWANGVSSRSVTKKLCIISGEFFGLSTSYYLGHYGMNVRGVI